MGSDEIGWDKIDMSGIDSAVMFVIRFGVAGWNSHRTVTLGPRGARVV